MALSIKGKRVLLCENKSIKKVEIPEGIEEISDFAFESCYELSVIEFPSTLKKIGNGAFNRCSSLLEVYLPEKCELIGKSVFENCTELRVVDMSASSITTLPDSCFYNCSKMKSLIFPQTLRTISFDALANLKTISLCF